MHQDDAFGVVWKLGSLVLCTVLLLFASCSDRVPRTYLHSNVHARRGQQISFTAHTLEVAREARKKSTYPELVGHRARALAGEIGSRWSEETRTWPLGHGSRCFESLGGSGEDPSWRALPPERSPRPCSTCTSLVELMAGCPNEVVRDTRHELTFFGQAVMVAVFVCAFC